jgi:hypothetical protein
MFTANLSNSKPSRGRVGFAHQGLQNVLWGLVFIVRWVLNRKWWAKPTLRRLYRVIEKVIFEKIEIQGTKIEQGGKTASAKTPLENPVIYGENEIRVRRTQENLGKDPYVSWGKIRPIAKNSGKTTLSELKRNPNAPARQPFAKRHFRLKRYLAALVKTLAPMLRVGTYLKGRQNILGARYGQSYAAPWRRWSVAELRSHAGAWERGKMIRLSPSAFPLINNVSNAPRMHRRFGRFGQAPADRGRDRSAVGDGRDSATRLSLRRAGLAVREGQGLPISDGLESVRHARTDAVYVSRFARTAFGPGFAASRSIGSAAPAANAFENALVRPERPAEKSSHRAGVGP